jgi:hypothetical protein
VNDAFAAVAAASCSLDDAELGERSARFAALAARGTRDGTRLRLPPELAAEAAELAVLETRCCPVTFTLEITRGEIVLDVRS